MAKKMKVTEESIENPEESASKSRWRPTSEQMERFLSREVTMCLEQRKRGGMTSQASSLFSARTWDAASRVLLAAGDES